AEADAGHPSGGSRAARPVTRTGRPAFRNRRRARSPSRSGRLRKRTPATPPAGTGPPARLPAPVAPQPEQREEDAQRGGDDQHRLAPDRQVYRHTGEGQREIVPARGRPSAHAVTPRPR